MEWNGSVDPEEVTRAILHVGGIANCYDKQNHNRCLDGAAWALSKMPQWHRPTDRPRRTIDRYYVDKFIRKDITVGPDGQTSQAKEPGLSSALNRYSVYASSIFASP